MDAPDLLRLEFATLPDLIRAHARAQPDRAALIHRDRRIDYSALDQLADRVAAGLQRDGVRPRDTVAICAATTIEWVAILVGSLRTGAAVAPLTTASGALALAAAIADSVARTLFLDGAAAGALAAEGGSSIAPVILTDDAGRTEVPKRRDDPERRDDSERTDDPRHEGLRAWMAPPGSVPAAVELRPDWPCNIIYSSGTTGVPKGIVQPHAFRWSNMQRAALHGYTSESVTLLATPLYSNATLASMFGALAQGGTVVLMEKFAADRYLALAQEHRATHTVLVPVQYQRVLASPDFDAADLESFQMKYSTGAPFAPALKEQVLDRWPGGLIEIYGMTEGGGACMLEAHKHRGKLHTVGVPMPRNDIRLIDGEDREVAAGQIGEIVGHSPAMMTGYLNRPAMTAAAEWRAADGTRFIRTGDIGRMDADGFLTLLDRKKDMIISGGFNVYPSDLEAVLREHPLIAEAAVVGVASSRWGETPVACVVLKDGAEGDAAEIADWANRRLGKMQRIESVKIMSSLPRNDLGKVLKARLRGSFS